MAALLLAGALGGPAAGSPPAEAPPRYSVIELPAATIELLGEGEEPRKLLRSPERSGERVAVEFTIEGLLNVLVEEARVLAERPLPVHVSVTFQVAGQDGAPRGELRSNGADLPSHSPSESETPSGPPSGPPAVLATIAGFDLSTMPSHDPVAVAATRRSLERLRGAALTLERRADGTLRAVTVPRELLETMESTTVSGDDAAEEVERSAEAVSGATWAGPDVGSVPQLLDRIIRGMVELFPPTPSVPVGVGASWKATVDERRNQVDRMVETTYTVKSIDEGVSTIDVRRSYATREPFQALEDSRGPEIRNVRVAKLSGRGAGTIRLDEGGLVPRTLDMQSITSLFFEGRRILDGGRRIVHEQDFIAVRIPRAAIGGGAPERPHRP